jgi:hypothetical protein
VVPPPQDNRRDDGELAFLYATSAAYGVTMGAWIDTLGPCSPNNKDPMSGKNVCDPGVALVAPLLLGAAIPLTFFLWDNFYKGGPGKGGGMHKGVPSSIGTGLIIGALEGLGVAGANFAIAGPGTPTNPGNRWGSDGIMTSVFVGATLGGIGGYAFGEAVRPDPRKIALIASGAGWGAAMGSLFGGGVANSDPPSVGQGMLVGNLVGTNIGVLTTGILAAVGYDPSWAALKYMWLGGGIGLLATSPIYLIYLAEPPDNSTNCNGGGCPRANHGMIANSFGILAGIIISGILTRDLKDPQAPPPPPELPPPDNQQGPPPPPGTQPPPGQPASVQPTAAKPWVPPFTVSIAPVQNGAMFGIAGSW